MGKIKLAPVKFKNILLTILFTACSMTTLAEGQSGLVVFIAVYYLFFILVYGVVACLIIKMISKEMKKRNAFLIGFIFSVLLVLLFGDAVVP